MTDRRRFLGGLIASSTLSPAARPDVALAADRAPARPALTTLDAVAETIVPRDRDPGALDADVPRRIRQVLAADREGQALYRDGLALVETLARRAGATSFAALDATARESLLRTVATQGDELGRRFFGRVREDVLRYYWASVPGQRVVGYEPPGGGYPLGRSQPRQP